MWPFKKKKERKPYVEERYITIHSVDSPKDRSKCNYVNLSYHLEYSCDSFKVNVCRIDNDWVNLFDGKVLEFDIEEALDAHYKYLQIEIDRKARLKAIEKKTGKSIEDMRLLAKTGKGKECLY